MTVKLYGFPPSTFTQTCQIALAEKGVSFELAMVDIRSPSYLQLHPFQKVPALEHGDKRVFEALAIIEYIDQVFAGPSLIPRDLTQRIVTLEWISAFLDYYAKSVLEFSVRERFAKALMGIPTDESVIEKWAGEMKRVTHVLDRQLAGNAYVAGANFGAADMFFSPVYLYFGKSPEGRRILAECANVTRWVDMVVKRASIQAVATVIDGLITE